MKKVKDFCGRNQLYKLADVPGDEQQRIIEVVGDWLKKMIKLIDTGHGVTSDELIVCPMSDIATLISSDGVWRCLVRGCNFYFPTDFTPPSPDKLKKIIRRIREEKEIRSIFQLTGTKFPF